MSVLISAAGISLVQLLLLLVAGLGPARLLLPRRLRRFELILAPQLGLAVLAVLGFYGANLGLTMRQILPIALVAAVVTLVVGLVRSPGGRLPGLLPLGELLPLLGLMLGTWVLQLLPLLRHGTLSPIGHNWDIEFYLPLADYLKDWSYRNLAQAPPNPLLTVAAFERVASRAMGGTYAQSMADLLLGMRAWQSWAPMLALLRALTLPGLYVLLRHGLGARVPAALLGTALAGANSLLLWTAYNSFGMSIAALALLPVALLLLVVALEGPEWRGVGAAALLLGGLTCTYWPMLQTYGVAALACGLAVLWERRHGGLLDTVLRGVFVVVIGSLLGLLAHLRAPVAWLDVFNARTPSMGVYHFISAASIAGSAGYSHLGLGPLAAVEPWLELVGLVAAALLLFLGLWRGTERRSLALALALASLLFLFWLRWGVRFPYGYLRGASYINTILLGLVGLGLPGGRRSAPEAGITRAIPGRGMLPAAITSVLALLLLVSTALASYRTYAVYRGGPALFGPETFAARRLLQGLERPGPVYLSAAPELRGPSLGALADALPGRELLGMLQTGFGRLANMRPGIAPAYAVLARDEDPRELGFEPGSLVGQTERISVYAAPPGRRAWLSGRPSAYAEGGLLADETTYNHARIGVGGYREALPEQPLALYVGDETLSLEPPTASGAGGTREVRLGLGSFAAQQVEIDVGGQKETRELPAGFAVVRLGPLDTPATITLRGTSAPVVLRWASLESPSQPPPSVSATGALTDTVLLGVQSTPQPAGATTRIEVRNAAREMIRLAVEIYEDTSGTPAHYAWTSFPATLEGAQQLELQLQKPAATLDGAALEMQAGDLRDGRYFAALWVYQGEQVRRRLPFLRFERREGAVRSVEPLDLNASFVRLPPLAEPRNDQFGSTVALRGFETGAATIRRGERMRAALLWEALDRQPSLLLVTVQLLDEADRKIAQWDGAAGGDWWPTLAWQPGQRIRQDIPLDVAGDAPPGRYRLIAGLYDPATGQRLRLAAGRDAVELGTVEVVP